MAPPMLEPTGQESNRDHSVKVEAKAPTLGEVRPAPGTGSSQDSGPWEVAGAHLRGMAAIPGAGVVRRSG